MRTFEEAKEDLVVAKQQNNWNDMVFYATEMLALEENHSWLWINRGYALQQMGFHLDAMLNYEKAHVLEPDNADFMCNIGTTYYDLESLDKAQHWYDRALVVNPNHPQVHLNLGNMLRWRGDLEGSLDHYKKCAENAPNFAEGRMLYGMALLKAGQFKEGWREYEWRWRGQLPPRQIGIQQWMGEDLTGKTIIIYGEQGLGDIIQFSRYAEELAIRFPTAKIIVEARHQVKRLLETYPHVYAVFNHGDKVPKADYAAPMITVAGMMTQKVEAIPHYQFRIAPDDVEKWKHRFDQYPGVKVGICWAGMARTSDSRALRVDSLRSASLELFGPLAQVPGVTFISLQKGSPSEQVHNLPKGMNLIDFTEEFTDFYDTAAVIKACDLVITVDTSVAHAAASVGAPTWVLNRWDGCYRWFHERTDSPYYPSARVFTQPKPRDWVGLIKEVKRELAEFVRLQHQPELNLTLAK